MDKDLIPCPVCDTTEHEKATNKGYLCKPCATERTKQWIKNNPDRYFFNQIKARFGLSKEDYLLMQETQNNRCAICNEEETSKNNQTEGTYRRLAIDHCHKTGLVRALLCQRCNTTLGRVKEDVGLLKKMVEFLEEHNGS